METIPTSHPLGGLLYDSPMDDALEEAIEQWDALESRIDPRALQSYAARFSEAEFARQISPILFASDRQPAFV